MEYHACRFDITQKKYNNTVLEFEAIKTSYANIRTFFYLLSLILFHYFLANELKYLHSIYISVWFRIVNIKLAGSR